MPAEFPYIAPSLRPLAAPISSVRLNKKNVRSHSPEQLAVIAESLRRFGFRQVVNVRRSPAGLVCQAGEGRLLAARSLGWTHAPLLVNDESAASSAAFGLSDNAVFDMGGDDPARVLAGVEEAVAGGVPAEAVGYSASDLDKLRALAASASLPAPAPAPAGTSAVVFDTSFVCPKCGHSWSGRAVVVKEPVP